MTDPVADARLAAAGRRRTRDALRVLVAPIVCGFMLLVWVSTDGWVWQTYSAAVLTVLTMFFGARICWVRGYAVAMEDAQLILRDVLTDEQRAQLELAESA